MTTCKHFSIAVTLLATAFCVLPSGSAYAGGDLSSTTQTVWDGEQYTTGSSWINPTSSTFAPESTDAHSGTTALEFKFQGSNVWLGGGWDWEGFNSGGNVGTDISGAKNFSFWIKSIGTTGDLQINLLCNGPTRDTPEHHTAKVHVISYCPTLYDGKWHKVVIPLADLAEPDGFNPKVVCQLQIGLYAQGAANGSFLFDDLAFSR